MIRVYADKRGEKYRLLVEGHATKGEGEKEVCAAVSALTGALVLYAKTNPVCRFVRTTMESGRLFLSCHCGLENAFEMIAGALALLSKNYPEHVTYCTTELSVDDKTVCRVL